MFDDQKTSKRFLNSPPSVPAAIAAVLEPGVAAFGLVICHEWFNAPFGGPSKALALLMVVLTFPGVNRFGKTGIGVGIHIGQCLYQEILLHYGVGVQEQDVFAPGYFYALVVGTGETLIIFIFYKYSGGELFPNHGAAGIGAVIIHHYHLGSYPVGGTHHSMQAYLQEVLYIIVNDNNRYFHQLSRSACRFFSCAKIIKE